MKNKLITLTIILTFALPTFVQAMEIDLTTALESNEKYVGVWEDWGDAWYFRIDDLTSLKKKYLGYDTANYGWMWVADVFNDIKGYGHQCKLIYVDSNGKLIIKEDTNADGYYIEDGKIKTKLIEPVKE